ncbi:hypothetical protein PYV02_08735 [Leifsonia sp. H3M29-4]|uniref:hypothetical protein n=1 Tax=Salinibacterium metalliresistens TaxID=3031321 RepID=UPI0023DC226B|nr:hypothetical protein [Salinibacterium metalliresistens]MDF1479166.1 hypothetical protein [Salinibacterium metalliresistens]
MPVFNVHVEPTTGEPDTVGATVFAGEADAAPVTAVVFTAPERANPEELLPAS